MDVYEEIEYGFYILRHRVSRKEFKKFLNTDFDKLDAYDQTWGKWIEKEIVSEYTMVYTFFCESGLYDKTLMSAMFLRMFYANERAKH